MSTAVLTPSLQLSVDRFARSLGVPYRLLQLHPRKRGNSGKYGALAPPIALSAISAFEGFTEDFFATASHLQGASFAQIAKNLNVTNPSLADVQRLMQQSFPTVRKLLIEESSSGWWKRDFIGWDDAVKVACAVEGRGCG